MLHVGQTLGSLVFFEAPVFTSEKRQSKCDCLHVGKKAYLTRENIFIVIGHHMEAVQSEVLFSLHHAESNSSDWLIDRTVDW